MKNFVLLMAFCLIIPQRFLFAVGQNNNGEMKKETVEYLNNQKNKIQRKREKP